MKYELEPITLIGARKRQTSQRIVRGEEVEMGLLGENAV